MIIIIGIKYLIIIFIRRQHSLRFFFFFFFIFFFEVNTKDNKVANIKKNIYIYQKIIVEFIYNWCLVLKLDLGVNEVQRVVCQVELPGWGVESRSRTTETCDG